MDLDLVVDVDVVLDIVVVAVVFVAVPRWPAAVQTRYMGDGTD